MTEPNFVNSVDEEIYGCLNLNAPRSFFLFAGAGSGKTRSLVEVLKRFRKDNIQRLRLNGQKVAIITYTNAARDEINRRLEFDPAFSVSTIHSFSWELIKSHQQNIREWLKSHLRTEIGELEAAQAKGRAGTKAAEDRPRQIAAKTRRLESLDQIKAFTYNPNGANTGKDSLNHAEVINLASEFLAAKPLMRRILIRKFPILLIDESQDTKRELMDAFFAVQKQHGGEFSLGLFGDTMQRIYSDGKTDLGQNIPDDWVKPAKKINYRCPPRVVALINRIRADVDQQMQEVHKSDGDGFVRLFIVDTSTFFDKEEFENAVSLKMAEVTGDDKWVDHVTGNKTLTLEHHMAALRGGFSAFFDPLYGVDSLRTGLLDGSLSGITFFSSKILPLVKSFQASDQLSLSRIVTRYSDLLSKDKLKASTNPRADIDTAKLAVDSLCALWNKDKAPTLVSILTEIYRSGLFKIPENLGTIAARSGDTFEAAEDESDVNPIIDAWDTALQCGFSEFEEYVRYISDQSRFGTHQGIKGLQFPRVMVILDDEEARGFLFSYDKLFGAAEPSANDLKNKSEGKETSVDRTRRLFYVTCSRAEDSLAIVAYTKDPKKVKGYVLKQGWFAEEEIIPCDLGIVP
ncbi:MAG: UvrD-helicase domain-containing protein [Gammaproteobacteria bacterium]|nr:UvrD-helicase domain-containing protein [Gammaproteobacteria bacterium]